MSVSFNKKIDLENNGGEQLITNLEEAHKRGIENDVLAVRIALDHFFDAKHKNYIVRARLRALRDKTAVC